MKLSGEERVLERISEISCSLFLNDKRKTPNMQRQRIYRDTKDYFYLCYFQGTNKNNKEDPCGVRHGSTIILVLTPKARGSEVQSPPGLCGKTLF